jgi:hypothetical protein
VSSIVRAIAGIASLLPLAGVIGVAGYAAFVMIEHDLSTGGGMIADPIGTFMALGLWRVLLVGSVVIALLQLLVMAAFATHALTRKRLAIGIKALWIVGFYVVGFVALPAYWLLYMLWDEPASVTVA